MNFIKKINNKGFTLIEILVVVVIIALLVGIAIPIISGTINMTRKKTLSSIASSVVDTIKDDILANDYEPGYVYYLNTGCYDKKTYEKLNILDKTDCLKNGGLWHQYGINDLLDKDMIDSPFGNKYLEDSYIEVTDNDGDGKYEYNVCIKDGENMIFGSLNDLNYSSGNGKDCNPPTNDEFNTLPNLDDSNANKPVLTSNSNTTSPLIAVYYDEIDNVWKKADSKNQNVLYEWYNYNNKKWANAVTVTDSSRNDYLKASLGTVIKMEDINTMWVWIPRFKATSNGNYNGGTESNPGAFKIEFVSSDAVAHNAFTFGSQNLSGFWVGKFENSSNTTCTPKGEENKYCSAVGEDCNLTYIKPLIIPNVTSWRGAMVSTYFVSIKNMTSNSNIYGFDSSYDTHMMKNSEWGAVAYLTQSIYGRCTSLTSCSEIGINNNANYLTGHGSPAGSSSNSSYFSYVVSKQYDTTQGMNASTTGNIYGIYDMSGGAEEYVMSSYQKRIGTSVCKINNPIYKWSGYTTDNNYHSGFNGCLGGSCSIGYDSGVAYPSDKYYDVYSPRYEGCNEFTSDIYNISSQHALIDTKNWYKDQETFINATGPWFVRGGRHNQMDTSGIFSYHKNYGNGTIYYGSRSVLVK